MTEMGPTSMELTELPLHPLFGVALAGLDLSGGVSPVALDAIRSALARDSVVVLCGLHLDAARQVDLTRALGTPKISQRKEFHVPGYPEVGRVGNVVHADGTPAAFLDRHGDLWHSDTSSDEKVGGVTLLTCVQNPPSGGDTLFCSVQVSWDGLPPARQAFLEGRKVVHNFNQHNDRLLAKNPGSAQPLSAAERARWPDRVHDLVQVHPVTGRKLWFLTPSLMKSISGLDDSQAEALSNELVTHATAPERVYRHRWQVGDTVLWDNRATLHSATRAEYGGGWRLMHRSYAYTA